jgi:hypothetical protein
MKPSRKARRTCSSRQLSSSPQFRVQAVVMRQQSNQPRRFGAVGCLPLALLVSSSGVVEFSRALARFAVSSNACFCCLSLCAKRSKSVARNAGLSRKAGPRSWIQQHWNRHKTHPSENPAERGKAAGWGTLKFRYTPAEVELSTASWQAKVKTYQIGIAALFIRIYRIHRSFHLRGFGLRRWSSPNLGLGGLFR